MPGCGLRPWETGSFYVLSLDKTLSGSPELPCVRSLMPSSTPAGGATRRRSTQQSLQSPASLLPFSPNAFLPSHVPQTCERRCLALSGPAYPPTKHCWVMSFDTSWKRSICPWALPCFLIHEIMRCNNVISVSKKLDYSMFWYFVIQWYRAELPM